MKKSAFVSGLIFPALLMLSGVISAQQPGKEIPRMDLHVHLGKIAGQSFEERYLRAANLSKRMGVVFGIAEEPGDGDLTRMDETLAAYKKAIDKYPLYLGLQVLRDGWTKHYSREALAKIDYVMADAMIMPVNGKYLAIWMPSVKFDNPEEFMRRYIEYHLKIFEEPVNIWCNATYLPDYFMARYDELWTEERMKTLIDTVVKKNIAIEINSSFKIPSRKFILMAKAAGAKFTIGSNRHDIGIGDVAWSINMARECGLMADDFFIPRRPLSANP